MACTCTMPEIHADARCLARFDTRVEPEARFDHEDHEDHEATLEEMIAFGHAELLRENAARAVPFPVCRDCKLPFEEGDPYFRRLCSCCGSRRVDELLQRSLRRRGRKATVKALKRLAR